VGYIMDLRKTVGHRPLIMCSGCGEYESDEMYFMPCSGTISCSKCGPTSDICIKMSRGAIAAMRHSVYVDLKKTYSFTLSDESLLQLCRASEAYIRENIDMKFKTLDFLKTLM